MKNGAGSGLKNCTIRFYAELNDFLPAEKRYAAATHLFFGWLPVKDLIESAGVSHTEGDIILSNVRRWISWGDTLCP